MAVAQRLDLDRFNEVGYLVVEDVLDPESDLAPVIQEYGQLLDDLSTRWKSEGKLPETFADLPFPQRFARIVQEAKDLNEISHFDISLPDKGVTEQTPIHLGPGAFGLLTNRRLLDAVEQIVGPEVYSNPIQHARIKPPEREVPEELQKGSLMGQSDWHQDRGVHLPEADQTDILTVWLPVTDATVENGCLRVIPGSHLNGLVTHCANKGNSIPADLRIGLETPVSIRRGGVLFMHHLCQHSSLSNISDGIRWSFDLRYHPIGQATGRPWLPGFVARSRRDPASAISDPRVYADLWRAARTRMVAEAPDKVNRWTGEEPICA